MSTAVQIRKGTTAEHATFTGALAEITVDTDKDVVVVHDGTTAGGFPLAKETTVGMRKPASVGGTVNAITATFSPAFTSLAACAGYVLALPLTGANSTTTPTLNIDGLGAKTIVKGSNEALAVANIPGADFVGLFVYDASLDKFQMVNPYAAPASQLSVLGFKNKIINGKMEIAQRGTSFAAIASGAYSLDRWKWINTSAAVATASQQTDVPSNNEFYNSLRTAVTTADTSIAAGDFASVEQVIEGSNVRNLIGNTFTLSFWVRSAKTGTHCVSFSNYAGDRSFVSEYTISVANTWEKKTILVSGGLITAGTWDWTNGGGLIARFSLAAGSTFQTTAGAWQTGNFRATSNQVNVLDTVGNIFAITGVQLEIGAEATIFDHRSVGQELELCQRYYQINGGNTSGAATTSRMEGFYAFLCEMRASPSIAIINSTAGVWQINGALQTASSVTSFSTNNKGVGLQVTVTGTPFTTGSVGSIGSGLLGFNAEL